MRLRYNLEWLDSGRPRQDLVAGRYRLGRGGDSDILIDATGVSREHAELIICVDRGLWLRDLGSTNGTRVDGVRIAEGAWHGDVDITLGSARLRLRERPAGLDQLAVVLDAPAAADSTAAFRAADVEPTAVQELLGELSRAARAAHPALAWSPAQLTALTMAWSELLHGALLRWSWQDAVVAQAGEAAASELVCYLSDAGWSLSGAPLPTAAARAVRQAAAELARWVLPDLHTQPAHSPARLRDWPGLAPASTRMRSVLEPLARAAAADIRVLLQGETGVGKELVAQWLHRLSGRAEGPFLAINCAALPRDLLEAELFGVERGAATGVDARPGMFERAHGGTLLLDEIGDTAVETQVRLLRVLEAGEVLRVGGRHMRQVDVRVVSATHRPLAAEIAAGRFRLDLYHRLAGYVAQLPPLRECAADIAPLATHFFRAALQRNHRHSPGITAAALHALQNWSWPGNVRELRQAIEHAVVVMYDGEALDCVHLPEPLRSSNVEPNADLSLAAALVRAERAALSCALSLSGGQPERAWTLLGIGKTSYYKKLREHGLLATVAEEPS